MSTVDLDEIDDQLDEVRRNVDHGEAPYNPWALTALRAAEALRAEVDGANRHTDATRQMAIDANAALRAILLSALDLEDDGRTPLTEHVTTLVAERDKARAAAAAIREVAHGNKQHVAWLTAILEAVEKCAAGYEQIDGGTEKVKVYAADVATKIRAALAAASAPSTVDGPMGETPRWIMPDHQMMSVLAEVADERRRQKAEWGQQNHPDGTGGGNSVAAAAGARIACQLAAQEGSVSWRHIMREEVGEAFAETDPAKLRAELVQIGAVAVAWIEAIDRRITAAQAGESRG